MPPEDPPDMPPLEPPEEPPDMPPEDPPDMPPEEPPDMPPEVVTAQPASSTPAQATTIEARIAAATGEMFRVSDVMIILQNRRVGTQTGRRVPADYMASGARISPR
jgi:hypothetical protein